MRGMAVTAGLLVALVAAAAPPPVPPVAGLDARLEQVKAALWPALDPARGSGQPAQPGYLYTRSAQPNVRLLDLTIRAGERAVPAQPIEGAVDAGPYPRHAWWVLPAGVGKGAPVDFVYTLQVKTGEGIEQLTGVRTVAGIDDDVFYELVFKNSKLGGTDAFLVQWRAQAEVNPILAVFRALVDPIIPDSPVAERDYRPGGANDPALRYAASQCDRADPLSGLKVLRAHGRRFGEALGPGFTLALARCALVAGLRSRAQMLLNAWLAGPGVPAQAAAAARLDFARADYRRGSLARARATLEALKGKLAPGDVARWRGLLSRVLFALGDTAGATALLADYDPDLNQDWTTDSAYARRLAFMRYNLAVGELQSGNLEAGRSLLYLLGTAADFAPSLRDQANLDLGWSFLESEYGASARQALSRVSLRAARSDRALLGYGWAMLADPGEPLARAARIAGDAQYKTLSAQHIDELYHQGKLSCQAYNRLSVTRISVCPTGFTYSGTQFLRDLIPEDKKPGARAAAIWEVLANRGSMSLAAIEARLAQAVVLARLGDGARAHQTLQGLLADIASAQRAVAQAQTAIDQGRLVDRLVSTQTPGRGAQPGWAWAPAKLPQTHAGNFLRAWVARNRTVALLQIVRDAQLLRAILAGRRTPVLAVHVPADPRALRTTLAEVETAARAMLRAEATRILARRSAALARYHRASLLALTDIMRAGGR